VEGSISPVACVDDPKLCNRVDACVTYEIWKKLKKAILEVFDSVTLEDMVKMQKKKLPKQKDRMYYI
jgi:DNA-binding IscR family transcriptional regulator